MEVKNVRCCETAALVALINMLKVNLSSTPQIYNTLLAVLCDFDPCKHGNRDRTVRYIRLLVTDKVLANCLLMSLPQGTAELQDLPLYTGSLPDVKKAIRHKFLGMKVSVQSPKEPPEVKSATPVTNQDITIIVTDQDEAKRTTLQESYSDSIPHTEPISSQQGNNRAANKTSLTKCIITFTKSSLLGQKKDVSSSMKSNIHIDSTVSTAVHSSQHTSAVRSLKENDNKTEHSVSTSRSSDESKGMPDNASDGSAMQSKLGDLVTLVQSRSEGKALALQDSIVTSPQGHVTNIPSPAYLGTNINYSSPCVRSELHQNIGIHPNSQARLSNPLLPLFYQQYAYPIPGSTSYQSCLTGYTANPVLPWTPLTYLPGYSPSQHFPLGQFGRPSLASDIDVSLDLSMQRNPCSQTQLRQHQAMRNTPTFAETRKRGKRYCSTSSVPNDNESNEPERKFRKLSTEGPNFSVTRYIPPNRDVALKSGSAPTRTSSSTSSYLCLVDNGENKNDNQENSLQALKELTFRINKSTVAQSSSCQNLLTPRKSLSTGSFSDIQREIMSTNEQKKNATGKSDAKIPACNSGALKHCLVPGTQTMLLPCKTPAVSEEEMTKLPQVSREKFYHDPPTIRNGYAVTSSGSHKADLHPRELDLTQREATPTVCHSKSPVMSTNVENRDSPVMSTSVENRESLVMSTSVENQDSPVMSTSVENRESPVMSTSVKNREASETSKTVIQSDTKQTGSVRLRSFPYSQHIQLPDGNVSVINFPALLPHSTSQSDKKLAPCDKLDAKIQEPSSFSIQSNSTSEDAETLPCGVRPNEIVTDSVVKDCPSRYSLYLKRNDTSSKQTEIKSLSTGPEGVMQNDVGKPEPSKGNETCLIIETTTENGTEQVQFKLDKKSSANLLGQLLKLKPGTNSATCNAGNNVDDSHVGMSGLLKDGHSSLESMPLFKDAGHSFSQNVSVLNNDVRSADDVACTPEECCQILSKNKENGIQDRHTKTKAGSPSEPESSLSSLNVSPYLLGILPDTTTFTDNDGEGEKEDYTDCDDDDDVFLRPIF